ncbi:DNA cytosine methyltransferase [Rhizobium wenxiniae]|uniref:DNA cytosine methyltransferase n=1 Tax=Rhizobium wenxiniae TaxID=1737357 RepID=UPI003C16D419
MVDRRSIEDIHPDDLRGFRQVHFFAGIGVWSYALRRAGVPDDANVWTGSCPCQPFSAAGKGGGVDDERHLWPHFHHLIRECRPALVFGEQVASKDGLAWLDLVHADMEASVYAFGALDTCAAGFGAPHIRQRLYWFGERVGNAPTERRQHEPSISRSYGTLGIAPELGIGIGRGRDAGRLDHHHQPRLEGQWCGFGTETGYGEGSLRPAAATGEFDGLADGHDHEQRQGRDAGSSLLEGLWFEPSGRCIGVRVVNADGGREGAQSGDIGEAAEKAFGGAWSDNRPSVPLRASATGRMADADLIDDDRAGFDTGAERREFLRSTGLRGQFDPFRLADSNDRQLSEPGRRSEGRNGAAADSRLGGRLADDASSGWREERPNDRRGLIGNREEGVASGSVDGRRNSGTSPTNGFWADADWLHCRDERWRPVEPFTFPLAHGAAARVGRLRGYGNAINAEQAIGFLEAFFEAKAIEIAPIHETTRNLDARSLTAELLGDLL